MDTPDRPEGALTPWSPSPPASPVTLASPAWADGIDPPTPKLFSVRTALRALRRHWWHILAIWAVGSAGLSYLAYTKVKPSFDAVSYIEVEPAAKSFIANINGGTTEALQTYIETQVILVTSPDVVTEALRDPNIARLPRVASSLDPEIDLRKEIAVVPQKGTHVILVRMSGENSAEVTAIVNAIVGAYLAKSKTWTDQEVSAQIDQLKTMKLKYEKEVTALRDKMKALLVKGGEANFAPGGKDDRDAETGGKLRVSVEEFRRLRQNLADLVIRKKTAEAQVAYLARALEERTSGTGGTSPEGEDLQSEVRDLFLASQSVQQLTDEIGKAETRYNNARRLARKDTDPAVKMAKAKLAGLKQEYDDAWTKMYPRLLRQVRAGGAPAPTARWTTARPNSAAARPNCRSSASRKGSWGSSTRTPRSRPTSPISSWSPAGSSRRTSPITRPSATPSAATSNSSNTRRRTAPGSS